MPENLAEMSADLHGGEHFPGWRDGFAGRDVCTIGPVISTMVHETAKEVDERAVGEWPMRCLALVPK
jgi:hypothetical protein